MTALYSVALVVGALAFLVWVAATAVANTVAGWEGIDPEARFGMIGRSVVAGIVGFGMAGMSASFGGWTSVLAFLAAVAGAVGLVVVAFWLGPEETP